MLFDFGKLGGEVAVCGRDNLVEHLREVLGRSGSFIHGASNHLTASINNLRGGKRLRGHIRQTHVDTVNTGLKYIGGVAKDDGGL